MTSWVTFTMSSHTLYLMSDPDYVIGILKMGSKKLFVRDRQANLHECDPLCCLDFYVHEHFQRRGYGLRLFEFMLKSECVRSSEIAYDYPSAKLIGFLRKHYSLVDFVDQANRFVVFDSYFEKDTASSRDRTKDNSKPRIIKHYSRKTSKKPADKSLISPPEKINTSHDSKRTPHCHHRSPKHTHKTRVNTSAAPRSNNSPSKSDTAKTGNNLSKSREVCDESNTVQLPKIEPHDSPKIDEKHVKKPDSSQSHHIPSSMKCVSKTNTTVDKETKYSTEDTKKDEKPKKKSETSQNIHEEIGRSVSTRAPFAVDVVSRYENREIKRAAVFHDKQLNVIRDRIKKTEESIQETETRLRNHEVYQSQGHSHSNEALRTAFLKKYRPSGTSTKHRPARSF
eukprot:66596_1